MDAHFSRLLARMSEGNKHVLVSDPAIVTITITSWLLDANGNRQHIDLDEIRNSPDLVIRTKRRRGRDQRAYVGFSNSVTVVFNGTKTIKVFSNGRLHATGCKTLAEAETQTLHMLSVIPSWGGRTHAPFSIVTLNTCVRVRDACISLDLLQKSMKAAGIMSRYNPDIYQGVVAKVPCGTGRTVSVMVFYTGTFIIAGVKTPPELEEAFNAVMPFMLMPCNRL